MNDLPLISELLEPTLHTSEAVTSKRLLEALRAAPRGITFAHPPEIIWTILYDPDPDVVVERSGS